MIDWLQIRWVEEGYRLDSRKQMTGTFFKIQNTNQQVSAPVLSPSSVLQCSVLALSQIWHRQFYNI